MPSLRFPGGFVVKCIRALFGSSEAQLSLANESWHTPHEKRNTNFALYWARRASRTAPYPASLLYAAILGELGQRELAEQEYFCAVERGAAAGDRDAQYGLGQCYEEGAGVAPDLRKALYWYTKAATLGSENAESAVARLCSRAL